MSAKTSSEDIIKELTGSGAGRYVLGDAEQEQGVMDALTGQGIDSGRAQKILQKIKMQETMDQTGWDEGKIKAEMHGKGGREAKSLREISSADKSRKMQDAIKKDIKADGALFNTSVTEWLGKIFSTLTEGDKKEIKKNADQSKSDTSSTGANLNNEAKQQGSQPLVTGVQ